MLKLKPNCERCNKDLPPDAEDALICSYECTFCQQCSDEALHNVCPNCGGGFSPRPIRPKLDRRAGVSLQHQPASTERVTAKYSLEEMAEFAAGIKHIQPNQR